MPLADEDTTSKVQVGLEERWWIALVTVDSMKQLESSILTIWRRIGIVWSQFGFSLLKACCNCSCSYFGKKNSYSVLWLWKSFNNISMNNFGLWKIKFNAIRLWTSKFNPIKSFQTTHHPTRNLLSQCIHANSSRLSGKNVTTMYMILINQSPVREPNCAFISY